MVTATRFQRQVSEAELSQIVRVPLLATIAAIVFSDNIEENLPTGRKALYERFVDHYLDGRASAETLMKKAMLGVVALNVDHPTYDQLRTALRRLLEDLAAQYLARAANEDLFAVATNVWVAHYPQLAADGAARTGRTGCAAC